MQCIYASIIFAVFTSAHTSDNRALVDSDGHIDNFVLLTQKNETLYYIVRNEILATKIITNDELVKICANNHLEKISEIHRLNHHFFINLKDSTNNISLCSLNKEIAPVVLKYQVHIMRSLLTDKRYAEFHNVMSDYLFSLQNNKFHQFGIYVTPEIFQFQKKMLLSEINMLFNYIVLHFDIMNLTDGVKLHSISSFKNEKSNYVLGNLSNIAKIITFINIRQVNM
jgi:hypothetical protein